MLKRVNHCIMFHTQMTFLVLLFYRYKMARRYSMKSCTHLGNKFCPHYNMLVDNAVNDLNCKLNNLLADFSHCNSSTLSVLFQSYCMNVYGCQIWSYNIKYVNKYYTAWRKAIRRIWKIDYRTHNKLLHDIKVMAK